MEGDAARGFQRHVHVVFDFGHINIIIDMRMVCGKVSRDRIGVKLLADTGRDTDRLLHGQTTFRLFICSYYIPRGAAAQ